MNRWTLKAIVYKDGVEYHAECIEAGAVGVGTTVWESISRLAESLLALARASVDEHLTLQTEPTQEDAELFDALERGDLPRSDVVNWGRITVTFGAEASADVESLQFAKAA